MMILNENYDWDDLSKEKKDRETVSTTEPWELMYLANKYGCKDYDVKRAIDAVGHNRVDVENWLRKNI